MSKLSLPKSTAALSLVKSSLVKSSTDSELLPDAAPLPEKDAAAQTNARDNHDNVAIASSSTRTLWLAVYFPKLAIEMLPEQAKPGFRVLDTFSTGLALPVRNSISQGSIPAPGQGCLVAVEKVQGRSLVHTVSELAAAKGIHVGMSLNAAYSLYADLQVLMFDAERQTRYLEKLAHWSTQYSSQVSIADSATLLLEVKGSLRYYGGMQNLLQQYSQQFAEHWPHNIQTAVAPTAAAAVLLSKTQDGIVVPDHRLLRSALANIRIADIPLSKKLKQTLFRLGLRRMQDLWRLPRQDMGRRYGQALQVYLDALTGMNTEMLDYYRVPDHFTCQWHLEYETRDALVVTRIVKQLLQKLEEYLIQCDYQLHGYCVDLLSAKKKPQRITIGLRKPGRDSSHLLALFEEQLKQHSLQQKVESVKLYSRHLVKASVRNAQLAFSQEFLQSHDENEFEIDELLELVQARLGQLAVKSVQVVSDHRPEFASKVTSVFSVASNASKRLNENKRAANKQILSNCKNSNNKNSNNKKRSATSKSKKKCSVKCSEIDNVIGNQVNSGKPYKTRKTSDAHPLANPKQLADSKQQTLPGQWQQRPLWLLPDPHPLRTQKQKPVYGDVLQLLEGPERIEAGWWSEAQVRRDYYYAMTPNGQRLWVYQELSAPYKWYLHGFFA